MTESEQIGERIRVKLTHINARAFKANTFRERCQVMCNSQEQLPTNGKNKTQQQ